MKIIKYIVGTIVIFFGILMLLNGILGLPEGIVAWRQGNFARSGAASGGLLFGPLIIWGAVAIWRSAREHVRIPKGPEISAADRVRMSEEHAD